MKKCVFALAAILAATVCSAQIKEDWAKSGRYEMANAGIASRPVAVLMGDSITDGWPACDGEFFEEYNLAGRGISGQTTSQMMIRFRKDVLDLQPKYVVILAGINDIARNECWNEPDVALGVIKNMCELAKAHKIRPVLCTLTPTARIPWRGDISDVPHTVADFNSGLKVYAKANHIQIVDYASVLTGADGLADPALVHDTVHPSASGYEAMKKLLVETLKLKKVGGGQKTVPE